jgi:hypothetical protein
MSLRLIIERGGVDDPVVVRTNIAARLVNLSLYYTPGTDPLTYLVKGGRPVDQLARAIVELKAEPFPALYLVWAAVWPFRDKSLAEREGAAFAAQCAAIAYHLAESGIRLEAIYIDHEDQAKSDDGRVDPRDFQIRAEYLRHGLGPFIADGTRILAWNFIQPSHRIPAKFYWGAAEIDKWATIDGTSCPECYCFPGFGRPFTAEAVWGRFRELINMIRSCAINGPVVPWLPVHWPGNPAAARWLTREIVTHAALSGVETFGFARYMAGVDWLLIEADTIGTLERLADERRLFWHVPPAYRALAIGETAETVTTRGYETRYADFVRACRMDEGGTPA